MSVATPTTTRSAPTPAPRRRQLRTSWVVVASLITLTLWYGSQRSSSGPDDGTALPGQVGAAAAHAQPRDGRFRLATYNIHGGRGLDTHVDLARIAACLRDTDLVALNEVHGPSFWQPANQAEMLARLTKLDWLFAPTEQRFWQEHFGNGVLSSLPVTSWQRIPLARRESKSYRNCVLVCATVDGRPLNVVVTHLDRSSLDRQVQLRTVVDFFAALAKPAVLMGDLNTPPDDPEIRRLLALPGVEDPLAKIPQAGRHIDWIVLRGLECTDCGMHERGPSDHPEFWVDCRMVE